MIKILQEHDREKNKAMVLREELIELEYHPVTEQGKRQMKIKKTLHLKKVCYHDEQGRYFEFISNSMESSAEKIAFLYKKDGGLNFCSKK